MLVVCGLILIMFLWCLNGSLNLDYTTSLKERNHSELNSIYKVKDCLQKILRTRAIWNRPHSPMTRSYFKCCRNVWQFTPCIMNIARYPTRHDNTSPNETNDIYLKQYSTQHGRKCLFITMAFSLGEHNCVGNTLKRKFSANYVNI